MTENKKTKRSLITKSKLLNAVEKVLTDKGFTELKVVPICKAANVDKKLIYFHFGDLNGLQTEFLRRQDFWESKTEISEEMDKETVKHILTNQFASIYENDLLKRLLIWELSEENETLKEIAQERHDNTNKIVDEFVNQQDFSSDVPPLLALVVGGLHYLSIRSSEKGNTFYGIDVNKKSDRNRVVNTMRRLIKHLK
ncbi:TetR/AcrR family transcriptional regulator [Sphingobacterium olei]|uniref:TetR/AcrR family transcriptional regulator n=1 Tax=Sphingobacterium olei TaxID=2571155 RepID=A0A4U0P4W8_9SPHI|nr:TetR/AcrR family transcriptional regulator [Sphingobacterium olei]TJZ62319.1 TetR/AcrR family transcriptional regulator [Sphingobacterium olei]